MTPHNEAKLEDIAETVLMPGDPLRAKYIAENFLEDAKLINSVRNMLAYTGTYKGKKITVFPSGMGMPSMGIYSYELFKFYNVQNIIRVGSCGAYTRDLKLFDTVLVDKSYTMGNFALAQTGEYNHVEKTNPELSAIIRKTASSQHINLVEGNICCSEVFDYYCDTDKLFSQFPKDLNIIGAEMEAFALFTIAKQLHRKAACLLTVVDTHYDKQATSSKDREKCLNDMITLALESAIQI